MQKPIVTVSADFFKSQVAAFTRKDGAFVAAHDSGKQAAAPKPAANLHHSVAAGLKDHLVSGEHETFGKVAAHLGHPEWKGTPSKSELAGIDGQKLQEAHDHLYSGKELPKAEGKDDGSNFAAGAGDHDAKTAAWAKKFPKGSMVRANVQGSQPQKVTGHNGNMIETDQGMLHGTKAVAHKPAGSSKPLHVQKQEKLDAEKAAAAKPNLHNHLGSGEAKSRTDPYDGHPNIVGKADKTDGGDHPSKAGGMHFLGNQYHATYKDGKSNHDQTPVREFRESNGSVGGGQSVWMDHGGRIHADSKSDVPDLRANYEAHMAKSKMKAKLVVRKPAAKPVHSDDAFAQIKAAGGKNVNTSSDGINYTHNGKESTLAHKDADDGHRYVDHGELQSHLGKIKDGGGAKGNLPQEPKKKGPMPFLQ